MHNKGEALLNKVMIYAWVFYFGYLLKIIM